MTESIGLISHQEMGMLNYWGTSSVFVNITFSVVIIHKINAFCSNLSALGAVAYIERTKTGQVLMEITLFVQPLEGVQ